MKVGIIRCMQTEDFCPGTTDFRVLQARQGAFEGAAGPVELVGFASCGGCPGKKAVLRPGRWCAGGRIPSPWPPAWARGRPSGIPAPLPGQIQEWPPAGSGGGCYHPGPYPLRRKAPPAVQGDGRGAGAFESLPHKGDPGRSAV